MKNNLISLFLSILLHIIIFLLIFVQFRDTLYIPPKAGSKDGTTRISIKDFKFIPSEVKQTKNQPVENNINTPKPQKLAKQDSKQEVEKREIKQEKKAIKDSKIKKQSEPQKEQERQIKQAQKQPANNELSKSLAQAQKPTQHRESPSIYSFGTNTKKEVLELYGDEIYSLNLDERKFIEDNLSSIGRITQRYLRYPQVAGRMGQSGYNVVEFYLYPNGDISDLKILKDSGYTMLDENSIHTIQIAYKDYPYPKVKTKIRIRVMYRLY